MDDSSIKQSVVSFACSVVLAFFVMALFASLDMSLKKVLWTGFGTVLIGLFTAGFPIRTKLHK